MKAVSTKVRACHTGTTRPCPALTRAIAQVDGERVLRTEAQRIATGGTEGWGLRGAVTRKFTLDHCFAHYKTRRFLFVSIISFVFHFFVYFFLDDPDQVQTKSYAQQTGVVVHPFPACTEMVRVCVHVCVCMCVCI